MAKYTAIGGQALIEGIMMKGPKKTALAVRTPQKTIDISYMNEKTLRQKFAILRIPVIRGIAAYIESMLQGYKAMMISADKSGFTDLEEEADKKEEKGTSALISIVMLIGTILGVALAVVLFMGVPRYAVKGLEWLCDTSFSKVARASIEQLIKLVVLVGYMALISLMKDIKRVFMYHGAEHKTIFCYEKGLPLTVENARIQSRFHPRCGTSFLILMIVISILFSTLVQIIFPSVYEIPWVWIVIKILLVPLICGVGFEVLRFCGKYDNLFTRIISAPGLWMQRITTKEPSDDMLEIAIAALKACEGDTPDVERPVEEETVEEAETAEAIDTEIQSEEEI